MTPKRPSAPLGLFLCALLPASGCSFIFADGPPANHRRLRYFVCVDNYAPPVLDTVWAGLNGLNAARAAASSDDDWTSSTPRDTTQRVGLVFLALSGVSAIYGYKQVGACRAAKTELMLRMERRRRGPDESWPPAPPPGYLTPPPGYPAPPPPVTPPTPGEPAPAPEPSTRPPATPAPAPPLPPD